jgi:hypothetical protein
MRTALVLPFLFVAAVSQASDSMTISGLSLGGGTGILGLSNVSGMNDGSYYAGPFDASLNGGATQRVYCADLLHHTEYNSATAVNVTDTALLGSGYQQAARIYNKYAGGVVSDATMNAALQAAIWKSIFPTLTYVDGTSGASALADSYLASSDLGSYSNHAKLYDFGGANQSMLGGVPNANPVPEPASMAALGVGAISILRRRKKA